MADAAAAARRRRPRPGLIDLYLIRGVAGPFLIVLVAVTAAMMLERSLRLIQELAASGADIAYLLPLLAQLAPYYLNLAIPAAFMVALVLLVARLDERLELEAMLSSGVSLARIAAPLVALGLAISALALVAGGWLEPLGRYNYRALRIEALNAGRIGRLQPRALYHPADSLAVTFDERESGGIVAGMFVWQRLADGRELVLTGNSARIGFSARERLFGIDLREGRYVATRPDAGTRPPYQVEFDSLAFRESLRIDDSRWPRGWDQKELTLPELLAAASGGAERIPRHALLAESWSRIARAATLPLLPLLVLPLAFATKKGRRGLGIIVAATILVAMHHSLNFAKKLALSGSVAPDVAVLGTAGLFALAILFVFLSGRHLPSHSPFGSLAGRMRLSLSRTEGAARPVPALRGRTLAMYLAWQLGKWTLATLVAIVALLQMVDLIERGEAFVVRGFGAADIARYAWLQLPAIVQQALPLAALTGAMATFAGLGRSHEITALRAAGISQWRILAMALPVPILLSLAAFYMAERAVPASQVRFAAWWSSSEPTAAAAEPPRARWFRIGTDIVRAGASSPGGHALRGVALFRRDRQGLLTERVDAEAAVAGPDGWRLERAQITRFESGRPIRTAAAELDWPVQLQSADVAAFFASGARSTAAAARRSLAEAAPVNQTDSLFETRVHRSAAEPLAPLIMLLLALPLAFVAPRVGRSWPRLLYAAAGGLIYLVADGVLTVAAQGGYLPAALGAWAAPALAVLTGGTVLLYSER